MSDNPILSFLSNINWSGAFQWYMNHLDMGYLIWLWREGRAFTQQDWVSLMLITANLIALMILSYLFINRFRKNRLNRTTRENHSPIQESVEPEVTTQPA